MAIQKMIDNSTRSPLTLYIYIYIYILPPRSSHFQNDALPSELQGQAENDLLSYDVSCISEVSPSMRKASY